MYSTKIYLGVVKIKNAWFLITETGNNGWREACTSLSVK